MYLIFKFEGCGPTLVSEVTIWDLTMVVMMGVLPEGPWARLHTMDFGLSLTSIVCKLRPKEGTYNLT